MIPDDGRERLGVAVEALDAEGMSLQRRLESAGITLIPLQARDFNDPSNGKLFDEILEALTAVSDPGDDGDLRLTTFAMSDPEAERIAGLIRELHRRVSR